MFSYDTKHSNIWRDSSHLHCYLFQVKSKYAICLQYWLAISLLLRLQQQSDTNFSFWEKIQFSFCSSYKGSILLFEMHFKIQLSFMHEWLLLWITLKHDKCITLPFILRPSSWKCSVILKIFLSTFDRFWTFPLYFPYITAVA